MLCLSMSVEGVEDGRCDFTVCQSVEHRHLLFVFNPMNILSQRALQTLEALL